MNTNISERTLPLQGIRVMLMLGIVLLHTYKNPVFGNAFQLVSFFFIVSGFLYRNKCSYSEYIKKKILGVFPLFWIVLFLSESICFIRGGNNITWSIVPHILLLQSWVPNSDFAFNYVGVAWFLSSLLFCYAVAPFLYKYVSKCSIYKTWLMVIVLYAIIVCMRDYHCANKGVEDWLKYINPLFCMFEYLLGMLLFNSVRNCKYIVLPRHYESVALIVLVSYFYSIYANWGGICLIHLLMIAFIYKYKSVVISSVLSNKYIVYLAPYMLFVYMTHQSITLNCLQSRVNSKILLVLLCFILGTIGGILFNRWIKPIIKRI